MDIMRKKCLQCVLDIYIKYAFQLYKDYKTHGDHRENFQTFYLYTLYMLENKLVPVYLFTKELYYNQSNPYIRIR